MEWLNPPAKFSEEHDIIRAVTLPKTDFWRVTHYDFTKQNAHFYHIPVRGDFELNVTVRGDYRDNYDQAGFMIYADETNWIKAGIEYTCGVRNISAVITREFSDWSVLPLAVPSDLVHFRAVRKKESVEVFYSLDGINFTMYRLGYLSLREEVLAGMMCASPMGEGFSVEFEGFSVRSI
ncbi:MAG: hypothetical protein A2Y33_12040 [Spirochaetes bacterium GWF1_51_8]|nr:MAG: hypothetical protein A2Y33_12040 [Spirochaetes bacterium GWF1_51_8]